jgi:hypothetical protein
MATTKIGRLASSVDLLAAQLPDADSRRAELRSRIVTLGQECGCAMGGVFLAGAAVLTIAYFLATGLPSVGSGVLAIGSVFVASLLGKLVGLGVARVKLLAIRHALTSRLSSFEVEHVHLH